MPMKESIRLPYEGDNMDCVDEFDRFKRGSADKIFQISSLDNHCSIKRNPFTITYLKYINDPKIFSIWLSQGIISDAGDYIHWFRRGTSAVGPMDALLLFMLV